MGCSPSAMRYDGTQVAVLSQFVPLAKCVTMRQIEALGDKLRATTKTAFVTLEDFTTWLDMGPHLDVYVRYLFESLKTTTTSTKVHAMELLAALAVCTTTSASVVDKIDLLCTLFTHRHAPLLKESDIAILVFATISGLKKLTVGLDETWAATGKSTREITTDLTTACCLVQTDNDTTTKPALPRYEFVAWCLGYKPVVYVLRHFIPGDILNPLSALSSTAVPFYNKAARQAQLYESLLDHMNPRENERIELLVRLTAAVKVQAAWKRHRARQLVHDKRHAMHSAINSAASRIQAYVKKKTNFLALMQRAAVERMALNGALLTFGSGIGVGTGNVAGTLARGADMVAELKLRGVRSRRAVVSSSCTFVETDQGWVMWGQCLPMYHEETHATLLLHKVPVHIDLKIPIASLACGRGHCVVLDTTANVYSWGWNDHGQTGHGARSVFTVRNGGATYKSYYDERTGQTIDYLDRPLKLPYFTGDMEQDALPIPISQVAAGDFFTLVLSTDGQVFSWGEGSDGQLGHGVECPFDVGYLDKRLDHSAFTFVMEPRAVVPLSNVRLVAACGNRAAALTTDHRVFEWGAWKRMMGEEIDPAFVPTERRGVQPLALRKLAIGAEHTVAEGASVWIRLSQKDDAAPCFVMLAEHACSIDAMTHVQAPLQVVALDFEFDDFQDDTSDLPKPSSLSSASAASDRTTQPESSSSDSVVEVQKSIDQLLDQLWVNRAQDVIPSLRRMKEHHPSLQQLQWPAAVKSGTCQYNDIVDEILIDVAHRVVLLTLAPPPGFYMELLVDNTLVVEIPLCPTSSCRRLTNRGIWCPFVDLTAADNQQGTLLVVRLGSYECVEPLGALDNRIACVRFSPTDLAVSANLLREDTIVECITASLVHLVVTYQEAGAIAVVAVFDFLDTEPFVVDIPSDQGLYIPVALVDMRHWSRLQPAHLSAANLEARLFHRTDNTPRLIRAALAHGARGVLLQQRAPPPSAVAPLFDGDVSRGDAFIYPHRFDVDAPLVAMVSYEHGQVLRHATHLDDSNHMVVTVQFHVEPTGHFYAWGCAENGRLGVGPLSHPHLSDGYDPRTDTPYRCATTPVVVPALCGRSVADVV
ncbi:hypothetical protein As57867_019596, partial [Aphanomyces stellatus]